MDTADTPRLAEALAYAQRLHADDVRKGAAGTPIPYIGHLLAVTALVVEDGGDEEEAVAALLHDAAEDHGGHARLADIEQRFGDRVARIVEACSDSLTAEGEKKADWHERKRRYLEALESPGHADALRVSAADKVHNARAIVADYRLHGERLWERFRTRSASDQFWYYAELARIHRAARPDSQLTAELTRSVGELAAMLLHAGYSLCVDGKASSSRSPAAGA